MADPQTDLDEVGGIAATLGTVGFEPILIGGMALVLMGSRRVTVDFDFVIAKPNDRLQDVLDVFYERGFELASRLNDAGDITATIDNRRVAGIRIRLDKPESVYFYKHDTGLRIDLLFDFPMPAASLAERATRTKVRSHTFLVASEADLLQLKKMARADRSFAGDAQDIEFLEARQKSRRGMKVK